MYDDEDGGDAKDEKLKKAIDHDQGGGDVKDEKLWMKSYG